MVASWVFEWYSASLDTEDWKTTLHCKWSASIPLGVVGSSFQSVPLSYLPLLYLFIFNVPVGSLEAIYYKKSLLWLKWIMNNTTVSHTVDLEVPHVIQRDFPYVFGGGIFFIHILSIKSIKKLECKTFWKCNKFWWLLRFVFFFPN